jgi:hypothetical protein
MFPINDLLREFAEARSKRTRIEALDAEVDAIMETVLNLPHMRLKTKAMADAMHHHFSGNNSPRMEEYVDANEIGTPIAAPIAMEVIDVDTDEVDTPRGTRAHTPPMIAEHQEPVIPRKQKRSGRGNDRRVEGAGGQGHSPDQVCTLGNQVFGKPTSAATKAILGRTGWKLVLLREDVLVL